MAQDTMFKVIDFDIYKLGCEKVPCDEQLKTIASDIATGLGSEGLIILKNSGLDKQKDKRAWECFDKFRELPEDDRKKYSDVPDGRPVEVAVYCAPNCFGNYTGVQPSNVEAFHFYIRVKDGGIRYPEKEVPGIVDHMAKLSEELATLCIRILQCLAIGQGQDRYAYDYVIESMKSRDRYDDNITFSRFNYYRPKHVVEAEGLPHMRIGGHIDMTLITIIVPDSEGLQAQMRDGKWVDVPLIPDTCLIQAGGVLSHMTGFHAPFHRVLFTGSENDNKPRRSTAFAFFPDKDVYMKPAPGAADQTPKRQCDLGVDLSSRVK